MGIRGAGATEELGALFLKVPGRLLVHVLEHRLERRQRGFLADRHGGAEPLVDVRDQIELFAIVPQFAALEVLSAGRSSGSRSAHGLS